MSLLMGIDKIETTILHGNIQLHKILPISIQDESKIQICR
jgi:hypothetical protein